MKSKTEILSEIKGMTRVEIEERIETLSALAYKVATSGSRFAYMADDPLQEISILEAYLKSKAK